MVMVRGKRTTRTDPGGSGVVVSQLNEDQALVLVRHWSRCRHRGRRRFDWDAIWEKGRSGRCWSWGYEARRTTVGKKAEGGRLRTTTAVLGQWSLCGRVCE
jgi:hypothetical protein